MSRVFCRLVKKYKCLYIFSTLFFFVFLRDIFSCSQKHLFSYFSFSSLDNPSVPVQQLSIPNFDACAFANDSYTVIHIALVIGGQSTTRLFSVLLKSLLFYRRDYVYLHLIVDKSAKVTLDHLFFTWKLPQLSVKFYNVEDYKATVSWIPNKHYSGLYGLFKLILPSILPLSLIKVIVLDADLIVTSNIFDLWKLFDKFDYDQVLGLVENQSDWYLKQIDQQNIPWPAMGRGFNTGVMLMHLSKLRQINWQEDILKSTKSNIEKFGPVQLADQDPINTFIVNNSHRLFQIPCEWNMQQGVQSILSLCESVSSGDHRVVKIIHWNSPSKSSMQSSASYQDSYIQNKLRRYFAGLRQTFIEYDGNLLRRDLIGAFSVNEKCKALGSNFQFLNSSDQAESSDINDEEILSNLKLSSTDDEDECSEIRVEQKLVRRTHLFFLEFNYTSNGTDDVTLVSQLSIDRLQILEDLARHWPGPMSLAVYVSDSEANQLVEFVVSSPVLLMRQNIAYHMVYKEGQFYPVNRLRNVALKNSVTDYVFIIDFDFLPSLQLYSYAREMIRKLILSEESRESKIGLIVPAFETFQYRLNFPRSKAELLTMLNTGEISPFRHDVWHAGHGATDYVQWKAAIRPYEVQWKADYEPYVIFSKKQSILFDTRFVGFGWNKVAFIMGLDILSFKFIVLPNAFIIHLPHAPSLDVARFRTTPLYRNCLNKFKIEYIKSLARKFGVKALKYLQFRKDQPP